MVRGHEESPKQKQDKCCIKIEIACSLDNDSGASLDEPEFEQTKGDRQNMDGDSENPKKSKDRKDCDQENRYKPNRTQEDHDPGNRHKSKNRKECNQENRYRPDRNQEGRNKIDCDPEDRHKSKNRKDCNHENRFGADRIKGNRNSTRPDCDPRNRNKSKNMKEYSQENRCRADKNPGNRHNPDCDRENRNKSKNMKEYSQENRCRADKNPGNRHNPDCDLENRNKARDRKDINEITCEANRDENELHSPPKICQKARRPQSDDSQGVPSDSQLELLPKRDKKPAYKERSYSSRNRSQSRDPRSRDKYQQYPVARSQSDMTIGYDSNDDLQRKRMRIQCDCTPAKHRSPCSYECKCQLEPIESVID